MRRSTAKSGKPNRTRFKGRSGGGERWRGEGEEGAGEGVTLTYNDPSTQGWGHVRSAIKATASQPVRSRAVRYSTVLRPVPSSSVRYMNSLAQLVQLQDNSRWKERSTVSVSDSTAKCNPARFRRVQHLKGQDRTGPDSTAHSTLFACLQASTAYSLSLLLSTGCPVPASEREAKVQSPRPNAKRSQAASHGTGIAKKTRSLRVSICKYAAVGGGWGR